MHTASWLEFVKNFCRTADICSVHLNWQRLTPSFRNFRPLSFSSQISLKSVLIFCSVYVLPLNMLSLIPTNSANHFFLSSTMVGNELAWIVCIGPSCICCHCSLSYQKFWHTTVYASAFINMQVWKRCILWKNGETFWNPSQCRNHLLFFQLDRPHLL